jgi:adenosylcobinamide-phosphate synthase
MSFGLALVAGAVEAGAGYPDRVYRVIGHPVTWMGAVIAWADRTWNSEEESPVWQRTHGVVLMIVLVIVSMVIGLAISQLFHSFLPSLLAMIPVAILASSLVAQRSLYEHVEAVADALGTSLEKGRESVAMIVGRDTRELDQAGVCRAAIESLAESFCDGVCAPIFWLTLLGLPGGLAYKVVNTADSMIGHKTERYIEFGMAAARTDDAMSWIPARLSVLWLALGALVVPGASAWRALNIARRDAKLHDSPNAGWPEAAMAGALGVRLMGPRRYNGELVNGDWLGDGRRSLAVGDVYMALKVYRAACAVQLGVLALLFLLTLRL